MRVLLLIVLLLLVALNGLFVAAEFGLVRSRKARLEAMANEGERGARQALQQIDRMAEFIAACQVGITLTSIGIGFLGEPALAKLLEPVFGGLSHAVAVTISVTIAFLLVTSIHITFGELTPKLLAITRAETTAQATGAAAWRLPGHQRAVHAGAHQGRERDRGAVRSPGIPG